MKRIKTYLLLAVAAFAFSFVFAPKPAQAAWNPTMQTLQDAIDHTYRLCGVSGDTNSAYCQYSRALNEFKILLDGKTPAEQAELLKHPPPGVAFSEADVTTINNAYLAAVSAHAINGDGTSRSVGQSLGSCGDSGKGVQLSVGVNSADECVGGDGQNPIYVYLRGIIVIMGGVIGLALVVTLIVSGIQYSSSGGDPQGLAKAKARIANALIGLLLYIMLAAILRYLIPNVFS